MLQRRPPMYQRACLGEVGVGPVAEEQRLGPPLTESFGLAAGACRCRCGRAVNTALGAHDKVWAVRTIFSGHVCHHVFVGLDVVGPLWISSRTRDNPVPAGRRAPPHGGAFSIGSPSWAWSAAFHTCRDVAMERCRWERREITLLLLEDLLAG